MIVHSLSSISALWALTIIVFAVHVAMVNTVPSRIQFGIIWVLNETKDACSCKYSCSLTVNSVSMRYNNGSFYSEIFYGHNATLAITHVTVISKDNSHDHKSQSLYYVIAIGSGTAICNIRERHCCSSKIAS